VPTFNKNGRKKRDKERRMNKEERIKKRDKERRMNKEERRKKRDKERRMNKEERIKKRDKEKINKEERIKNKFRTKTLHQIGSHYKTDKAERHRYLDIYEKYLKSFRDGPVKLLEIGYKEGNSARMWEAYFSHNETKLYAVDNKQSCRCNLSRTKLINADQSNRQQLINKVARFGGFDVIIDDGVHKVEQQLISFGVLFKYLNPNGLYFIEDVFLAQRFPTQYSYKEPYLTYDILKWLKEYGIIYSDCMLFDEIKYIEDFYDKCIFEPCRKSNLCIIKKKF